MTIKTYQITPEQNILISANASSLDDMTRALPQGFYTTFSTLSQGTRVFGLSLHLQRLYVPAREIGLIPVVSQPILRERVASLVKKNLPGESRIRIILTKGTGSIYLGIQPFEPLPKKVYEQGVHVITSEIIRHDPRIKETGFISESASQRKSVNKEVFEVLLAKNGQIFEGMTSNFYAVKGKTLITARRGILFGITRRIILRLAREQGMYIEYRSPRLDERFNEAFLTSSSRGVVPIISIDGISVGEGSVGVWTKILSKAYQTKVGERSEKIIE